MAGTVEKVRLSLFFNVHTRVFVVFGLLVRLLNTGGLVNVSRLFVVARVFSAYDPKLSDRGARRGTCTVGGKVAVEAGAVTHGAVRCSAWLGACDLQATLLK